MEIPGQLAFNQPASEATETIRAVEVRRSARRRRTVEARLEKGTLIVYLPERMSKAEESLWISTMIERVEAKERKSRLNSDGYLERRARELNQRVFGGRLRWTSIGYVTNQRSRYGSCTVRDATIRLSDVLADYPTWVIDYVIVHELAHLEVPDHSPRFWSLVNRYPLTERARGFLIAKGLEEGSI